MEKSPPKNQTKRTQAKQTNKKVNTYFVDTGDPKIIECRDE